MSAVRRSEADAIEHEIRAHWHERVHATCAQHAALLGIIPWEGRSVRKLPPNLLPVALAKCQQLVAWCCRWERRNGERSPSIEQDMNAALWRFLKPYRPDAPPPESGAAQGEISKPSPRGNPDAHTDRSALHDGQDRQQSRKARRR